MMRKRLWTGGHRMAHDITGRLYHGLSVVSRDVVCPVTTKGNHEGIREGQYRPGNQVARTGNRSQRCHDEQGEPERHRRDSVYPADGGWRRRHGAG